jgi:hypothetical protein
VIEATGSGSEMNGASDLGTRASKDDNVHTSTTNKVLAIRRL